MTPRLSHVQTLGVAPRGPWRASLIVIERLTNPWYRKDRRLKGAQ